MDFRVFLNRKIHALNDNIRAAGKRLCVIGIGRNNCLKRITCAILQIQ